MKILAGCTLEEGKKFSGKLTLPNEDSKTPDKVVLNIKFKEGEVVDFTSLPTATEVVTYEGITDVKVPDKYKGKVFNSVSFEEYKQLEGYDNSLPLLVYLPDGYCNMFELKQECDKNPNVRFIGGNLLAVEGVRIGRFEEGKDKLSPVFCGTYDTFMEAELSELEGLVETVKKNRKKLEGSQEGKSKKSAGGSKKPKQSSKKKSFTKLFSADSEDF